jgi:hypothetical protein
VVDLEESQISSLFVSHVFIAAPRLITAVNASVGDLRLSDENSYCLQTVYRTAKSPMLAMALVAFTELLTAVELVGRGAIHSPCCRTQFGACNSNITHLFPLLLLRLLPPTQPILHGSHNKPAVICTASHTLDAPLYPVSSSELADEKDFEILGGQRATPHHSPSVYKYPPSSPA